MLHAATRDVLLAVVTELKKERDVPVIAGEPYVVILMKSELQVE